MAESRPEIEEVWLFGSMARGDAVPGSDADLMVLLTDSQLPFLERPLHYQLDFCGVGTDVLAYTRAELSQMKLTGNRFLRTVHSEGICIFQRETLEKMTTNRISND